MMKRLLIATTLAAGVPTSAIAGETNPLAQIMITANAYDRCVTTYAVKLLESGLSDDDLYVVASTMCRDLNDLMKQRIIASLPAAQANEMLARLGADPKGDYLKKLQAIRQGRSRRAR